ncbi:MAG: bifunctional diaminohydroxyphosphoribosylaminopyrimidine deaminase/5-amino-6-(5-phosphoribosylamino)uracil reductase RibD [Bacteroidales bacterium]|nr:bifunctional diaminohydroxyphosphoribosylaminopyrimidine deaminase/5-amino-6-(5-phosphoribosylamino)uracil reductase RibD [Bacteroidales bacterium]
MNTNADIVYMRRCLQLAASGLGRVRPNPLVGCVVVRDGQVLSEGFHQEYGHNHAERNALMRAGDFAGATLYVNLEPCSHYGKTPPCADLVVERGIKRVVCCNDDPNPLVSGRGFERLEKDGIEVVRHLLCDEGRMLNRRFFTFMEKRRPYVILKWAESADGYLAPANIGQRYWITTPQQDRLNHRWRTEEAAILVGSATYLCDNPSLTARHFCGPQPQPIVLDRRGRLAKLPEGWIGLQQPTVSQVLDELYHLKIQSVIVEGGRQVLDAFLATGLYDEVRVLRGPELLGGGLKAPAIPAGSTVIMPS